MDVRRFYPVQTATRRWRHLLCLLCQERFSPCPVCLTDCGCSLRAMRMTGEWLNVRWKPRQRGSSFPSKKTQQRVPVYMYSSWEQTGNHCAYNWSIRIKRPDDLIRVVRLLAWETRCRIEKYLHFSVSYVMIKIHPRKSKLFHSFWKNCANQSIFAKNNTYEVGRIMLKS